MSTAIGHNIQEEQGTWHIVDAKDVVLGRLASKVAMILMGKHKPNYTRHIASKDHVVVINASQIKVTGTKKDQKIYKHFTGYPSGLKEYSWDRVMEKSPTRPVTEAVKGMLPKSNLGHNMLKKLHVYADANHKHEAQQPTELKI